MSPLRLVLSSLGSFSFLFHTLSPMSLPAALFLRRMPKWSRARIECAQLGTGINSSSIILSCPLSSSEFKIITRCNSNNIQPPPDTNTPSTQNHRRRHRRPIRPIKPAVQFTLNAKTFFQRLFTQIQTDSTTTTTFNNTTKTLDPTILGFRLLYQQSQSGQPRMVFTFDLVRKNQLGPLDEGIPLYTDDEITNDEKDTRIKPMLYIHHGALIKVLGCTIDVEIQEDGDFLPILYDAQGEKLEP